MTSASNVTIVPVSGFPAADTLDGTEIVPLVQDGLSKRTTAQAIADLTPATATTVTGSGGIDSTLTGPLTYDVKLADMPEETVKGRAKDAGDGAPTDLTAQDVSDIVWDAFGTSVREDNNVGYLTVEPGGIAAGNITQNNSGKGLLKTTTGSVALTIATEASEPIEDGTVITVACTHASGVVTVTPAGGVSLLNFNDGSTGARTLTGVGLFTLWKIGSDSWGIHGSQNLA